MKTTSPEAPPQYLWVDLRALRNDDGTTGLFTTGLPALGHMEIEIPRIDMEPGDLREWLLNIMYYLLAGPYPARRVQVRAPREGHLSGTVTAPYSSSRR